MSESRVKELFQEALDRPAAERGAFLDRACAENSTLRARVEALLEAHEEIGPFLHEPTYGALRLQPVRESAGTVIGNYKLLQKIGEGGFGVVYMAEQTEPVRRNVALKILKLGMDTRQVVARFDAERQALAVMDHPNIAKVLDAGATETGRPYFAMELVKGIPITEYCDQAKLDTAERLMLFQDVCRAVQHAHHKGIIHRDLKPSNILVTLHDGRPVPKVIDFGIAKATDHRLTQKTLFTEFRQMVGTPEYMAPEQAELGGLDIDTRADVYALGVVLYELLTGAKPFDLRMLLEMGYDEVLRTIREVEPPKPSTRVSTMGDQLQVVARNRHTQPKFLGRVIRGDLDWIVMKALEKDRSRRYETADGFAQDIERYLQDQPVLASPPSGLYRLRKYVRRHRIGVVAAAAVLLSVTVGGALALAGYVEAGRQRDLAQGAATEARTEAQKSAEVVLLMREMVGSADPHEVKGKNYTVRQLLDDFDRDLGTRHAVEPEVEATVRLVMGDAFLSLGLPDRAEPHITKALRINEEAFGESSAPFADGLVVSARLLHSRGEYAAAEKRMRRVVEIRRGLTGDTRSAIADGLCRISDYENHLGRYDEAERLAREALAIRRDASPVDAPAVAANLGNLASALANKGEYDEAERVQREALAIRRQALPEGHPDAGLSLNNLAVILYAKGDYDGAEKLHRDTLANNRKVFGEDHPKVATSLHNLAVVLDREGRYDEAEKLQREALAIERKALGDDHPVIAKSMNNLAEVLRARGDYDEAEKLHREALAIRRRAVGGDQSGIAVSLNNLALDLCAKGAYDEAEQLHREALAIRRKVVGGDHPDVAKSLGNLADVLRHKGDYEEAEKLQRESLAIHRTALGNNHPDVAINLHNLGLVLYEKGDYEEAERLYRESLAITRKALGDDHPGVGASLHALAHVAESREQDDQAEQLFREALDVHRKARSDTREDLSCLGGLLLKREDHAGAEIIFRELVAFRHSDSALAALGLCLVKQGKNTEAEPILRECLAIREKQRAGTWFHYNAMSMLGGALSGQGKYAEAEPLLVEGYEKMAPPESASHRKREALDRIVSLYEAWGKPEKAAAWRARCEPR